MKALIIFLLAFVLDMGITIAQVNSTAAVPYGKWIATDYIQPTIGAMTDKEAKKYLNKIMIVKPSSIVIIKDSCKILNYRITKEDRDSFFYNELRLPYRSCEKKLPLPKTINVLSCDCLDNNNILSYSKIVIANDRTLLVLDINSYFYIFKKDPSP